MNGYSYSLRRIDYDVPIYSTSIAERHVPGIPIAPMSFRSPPAPPINGRLAVVYTPKCRSRFQRCSAVSEREKCPTLPLSRCSEI
jgi:hypothetical protein